MEHSVTSLMGRLASMSILRFAAVGAVSTIIDIFLLNVLHAAGLSLFWATALAFIAGASNGYLMNNALVFGKQRSAVRYSKYLLVSLGGLIWTELIVHGLERDLGLNGAKLVAVALVFTWNYTLSKRWAFK